VDKLTGANTFGADDGFGSFSVFVGVVEDDFSQRSTSARIVNDVFDQTLDETVFFGVIERSHFGSALTFAGDGGKDGAGAFSLSSDDSTHFLIGSVNFSVSST